MPLGAHFYELRKRVFIYILSFIISFIIAYPFSKQIFKILIYPLANAFEADEGRKLIYTGLAEAFVTYVRVSLFVAFFISFPVFFSQIWSFIVPGLLKKEKKLFSLILFLSPALFFIGASFAFFWVIPLAWKFFLSFESSGLITGLPIKLEAKIGEYFSMILQMLIAFGLSFQLPLVLLLLAKLKIIKYTSLVNKRHYAIILILIFSAVLTPPDVLSMISLACPLYLLYEISIILIRR